MSATSQPTSPYLCHYTKSPLTIDGDLSKSAWQQAPRSGRFVDVVSGSPAIYDSRAAALWDETNLYIAFWCEEPFVAARMTRRDDIIFRENDVEVFIDGGDCYYELELNALGTLYEVLFIWQDAYRRGGRFDVPEFDLHTREAVSFGGNHDRQHAHFWRGTHPRGNRWAFLDWDFPGLQVGIQIDGTINDPTAVDKGWTVELAFPWAGMGALAGDRPVPPHPGDIWRIFFARYEKFDMGGETVHAGWAWDPIGSTDNHQPDKFTPIQFSRTDVLTLPAQE